MSAHAHNHPHGCCGAHGCFSRRDFMIGVGAATAVGALVSSARAANQPPAEPAAVPPAAKPKHTPTSPTAELVVQPVLTYGLPQPHPQTSWRGWGGIQTTEHVAEECARIERELREFVKAGGFSLRGNGAGGGGVSSPGREASGGPPAPLAVRFLPLAKAATPEEAAKIKQTPCDVMLIYAAGGGQQILETLASPERPSLYFLRHDSGPVYLWYEILHNRFMRKTTDRYVEPNVTCEDVVVDDYPGLAWRLRALLGLKRTLGSRIIAIGGASGWGSEGYQLAPQWARERFQLDIVDVPYRPDLAQRIEGVRKDARAVAAARVAAAEYLQQPGTTLETDQKYLENAFLLTQVFRDLMQELDARALTINECMGTIMPMSETTACLPLTLINDAGDLAFCESDFVVIPAGVLMHHITGLPVFLNDPTWPHDGHVTIAHCTAPRKLDGRTTEPARLLTHFESDYGVAPKVEFRIGQVVTNVIPDFGCKKWVGFKGTIAANPFLDICRSQTDVAIDGDWRRLLEDMRGFHWMTVYGDCRREVGYALRRLGIEWQDVS